MNTPTCIKSSRTVDGEKKLNLYMITYPNRVEYVVREERKDASIIRAVPTLSPEAAMDSYYELLMTEDKWEMID